MKPKYHVNELVGIYRQAAKDLKEIRAFAYKRGDYIRVDTPRFKGIGFVDLNSETPPDQLSVTLGNGNTWNYPLEDIIEIIDKDSTEIPSELKRLHSRFRF